MGAGFSVSAWLFQYLWTHLQYIFESYYQYILAYFVIASTISFGVCYYKGPVTNPRLLDLIQWSIQLLGIIFIYLGCQITEVAVTVVAVAFIAQHFPRCLVLKLGMFNPMFVW